MMTTTEHARYRYAVQRGLDWGDMDANGLVGDVVLIKYFEAARVDLFRDMKDFRPFGVNALTNLLTDLEIVYLKRVSYPAMLEISVGIHEITSRGMNLACTIRDSQGGCAAVGRSRHILFNLQTGRPVRMSNEIRSVLEKIAEPSPAGKETERAEGRTARARRKISPEKRPFTVPLRVVWGDMDASAHVNNASFARYFETARAEYYEHLKRTYGLTSSLGARPLISDMQMSFRQQVKFPAALEISLGLSDLGSSTHSFECAIINEAGDLVNVSTSKHIWVDNETGKPACIPDDFRRAMQEFSKAE